MHPSSRGPGSDDLTRGRGPCSYGANRLPELAIFVVGALLAMLIAPVTSIAAKPTIPSGLGCLQLPVASPSVVNVVWEGAFTPRDAKKRREYSVCIHLPVESRITVEIDAPELSTVGHVQFPDGHQEGAPGGRFFNETLPAGYYRMLVGQRWPMWKPGTFKLIISVG